MSYCILLFINSVTILYLEFYTVMLHDFFIFSFNNTEIPQIDWSQAFYGGMTCFVNIHTMYKYMYTNIFFD